MAITFSEEIKALTSKINAYAKKFDELEKAQSAATYPYEFDRIRAEIAMAAWEMDIQAEELARKVYDHRMVYGEDLSENVIYEIGQINHERAISRSKRAQR